MNVSLTILTDLAKTELESLIPNLTSFKLDGVSSFDKSTFFNFKFETEFYRGTFSYSQNKGTRNSLTIAETKIKS
ncbi:hypothetical protein M1M30_gp118 [Maribacter phage Colly_1]|uniref:Uncharacterized protein n=1 Tax=Maribacter phage Colly_1 TaxID=2745691 RepID=A0A8E4UXS7_9CAUD|nr:hypothetical protein M1M30_gp118 [Maribacter phage Colly_1]QQO97216.1 hypothetical protein Colly1_118 [Maribacter phage Colly_1]